jgi:preprotein translocase subunit SecA
MARVSGTVLVKLFETKAQRKEDIEAMEQAEERRYHEELAHAVARHPSGEGLDPLDGAEAPPEPAPARRAAPAAPRIGRNDPCPCGSGKKFKKCHGALLEEGGGDDDDDTAEEPQPRA